MGAEYEKSPFSKDTYEYVSQIKGDALRRLKTECKDCLVIGDVLVGIKILMDKNIEPS